jgi:hypothetical protein
MNRQQIEDGAFYLAEIKALEDLYKHLEDFVRAHSSVHGDIVDRIHLLGTDYGKPNASKLMTKIAEGNRLMFWEIKQLTKNRIEVLEEEFKKL